MHKPFLLIVGLLLPASQAVADTMRPSALILSVDGAGDYRGLSTALQKAVADAELPLLVEPAAWSHGHGRCLADQVDRAHVDAEGRRLAERILALRRDHPERPVYVLAHSAGAAVVMAAGRRLPPDSVERIIFLAPTISAYTDVSAALVCSRQGLDVFYSARDCFGWLVGFTLIGAEGRLYPRVAARVGFLTPPLCPPFQQRLRQHAWSPAWQWTGHEGGHFGIYQQGFLHAVVLPLLTELPR